MKKLYILIKKSKDFYDAFAPSEPNINGAGESVEACMANVMEGLEFYKETTPKEEWPEALKGEYKIEYQYDVASFLKYYSDILTLSGLSRLTGINQGLLSYYVTGLKKPRKETVDKIEKSLHKLGKELCEIDLV